MMRFMRYNGHDVSLVYEKCVPSVRKLGALSGLAASQPKISD